MYIRVPFIQASNNRVCPLAGSVFKDDLRTDLRKKSFKQLVLSKMFKEITITLLLLFENYDNDFTLRN